MKRIKHFFLTTIVGGFVVLLPITIIVVLINFVFKQVGNLVEPFTKLIDMNSEMDQLVVNVLAFAILIAFCFMVGLFVRTRSGKNVWAYIEMQWLSKLPLYNVIKETVQQFSGAKKMPFKQVVLVDPFGNGTKMTGFVTDEHQEGLVTVFVPTAPNPTNGFVFHVASHQIEHIDADPQDALRSIIGIGVGSKELVGEKKEAETADK